MTVGCLCRGVLQSFLFLLPTGGEFPVVVIPLHDRMPRALLSRTLLYTALTRAKQLVVLVGTDRALDICMQTATTGVRMDSLMQRLQQTAQQAKLETMEHRTFK